MSFVAGSTSRDLALGGTLPSASYVAAAAARSSAKPSSSSSSSSTSSSTSAYSSFVTIIRRSTGMSSRQAERAVGYSAITGTSLVALRVLLYAFRLVQGSSTNNSIVDDEISDCTTDDVVITKKTKRATRTTSNSILSIFRRTLRRILLDDDEPTAISNKDTNIDQEESTDGPLITHQGSCHCESIQFTVLAPRCLAAQDGPGKIQFQHTEVRTSNFRVYAGHECLKTYYVVYRDSGKKGAHAFCERCGVHVLYAPSKQGKNLFINVRCLDDDGDRKVKIKSKKSSISDGIPAAGQFDHINSDQLSTISEVTQPFHFQMNNAYNHLNTIQYPTNNKHDRHNFRRFSSDTSSIESSTGPSVEGAIEVPIKQFYATTTTTTTTPIRKSRRQSLPVYSNTKQQRPTTPTTSTATTASLTTIEADFDSSSSLYKGQLSELEMMVPTSPPREGGASLGGIDDFSFSGETISLMDDTSVMSGHLSIASSRRKPSLRVSTGGLPGNHPPRHPTVTSPETRNKMKYFMAKYKSQENNQNVELN